MREVKVMCLSSEEAQARQRSFDEAMDRLASKNERPTIEEVEEVFRIGSDLPLPNFSSRLGVERARNTKRYRDAAQEAERVSGTRSTGIGEKVAS